MVTLKQQLESSSTIKCALAMITNAGCCFCLTFNEENEFYICNNFLNNIPPNQSCTD